MNSATARGAVPPLAILDRTRERSERILGQNASNTAKALAKDALELCAMVDDFREELRNQPVGRLHGILARLGMTP